jgi:predicted DNA-binding protein
VFERREQPAGELFTTTVRLDADGRERLDAESERLGISRSEYVRAALHERFARQEYRRLERRIEGVERFLLRRFGRS